MTRPPTPFERAVADSDRAIAAVGRQFNEGLVEALRTINRNLEESRRMTITLTAPIVATTLDERVALVEQFDPRDDVTSAWRIAVDPTADAWVLEWHTVTLVVTDLGELEFARIVAHHRAEARRHLRRTVIAAALELGLPTGPHLRPATRPLDVTGRTRCPGCGANVRASQHQPGGPGCTDTAHERATGHRD